MNLEGNMIETATRTMHFDGFQIVKEYKFKCIIS